MRHETACYAITVKQKPKSCVLVPCWNKECDEAVMNVAYRRMRKCLIFINAMEYMHLRAVARRVIKDTKSNTLGPETPVRQLWSAVCKMSGIHKRRSIPVLQRGDVEAVSNKKKKQICVLIAFK